MARLDLTARPAVQHNDRLALRVAAFLDIKFMPVAHGKPERPVRLGRGINDGFDVGPGHGVQ